MSKKPRATKCAGTYIGKVVGREVDDECGSCIKVTIKDRDGILCLRLSDYPEATDHLVLKSKVEVSIRLADEEPKP